VEQTTNAVHPTARVGRGTTIGAYTVLGVQVVVGEDCVTGNGVVLHPGTQVGDRVRIDDHAVLGKRPMRGPRSAITRESPLEHATVGDDSLISTAAIVYAGARLGRRVLIADLASIRENSSIGDETGHWPQRRGRKPDVDRRAMQDRNERLHHGDHDHRRRLFHRTGSHLHQRRLSRPLREAVRAPRRTDPRDGRPGRRQQRGASRSPHRTGRARRAGAVVTRDVPARTLVMGIPAAVRGPVPEDELLENQPDRR